MWFNWIEVKHDLRKCSRLWARCMALVSLAGATLGVMQSASLAVALIGQARGLITKHAIKQVDRLLSNNGIDVWDSFARWVAHQIGERRDILVAMDWTDFDHDDQATLALHLVTGHGRAAPRASGH